MMRTEFDEQLATLNEELIRMGMLCETAIGKSSEALLEHDLELARKVQGILSEINEKNRNIESICLQLLLRQQPVAQDLRTVSSALKMVTDMNRIGIQSEDIAEIVLMNTTENVKFDELPIKEMSSAVIKMVTESVEAFVKRDAPLAQSVVDYDDVVDNYFDQVRELLIERLKKPEENGGAILDLLMVAKYLERIGDHAVNIAEWVIFSITGMHGKVS